MSARATITVRQPRDAVQRLWSDPEYRPEYVHSLDANVRFADAPGDRGTEIHIELQSGAAGGKLGEMVQKLRGAVPRAKVTDELRHFKQLAETGVIARSEAAPEGERLERKFKRRPAQPLREGELQKAGV